MRHGVPHIGEMDIRDAIKRLEMTSGEAAALFGVTERGLRMWLSGEHPTPRYASRIVTLALALRETYGWSVDDILKETILTA